jgi:hypothetical protein
VALYEVPKVPFPSISRKIIASENQTSQVLQIQVPEESEVSEVGGYGSGEVQLGDPSPPIEPSDGPGRCPGTFSSHAGRSTSTVCNLYSACVVLELGSFLLNTQPQAFNGCSRVMTFGGPGSTVLSFSG